MSVQSEVSVYLEEVRNHLHLDPRTETRVMKELTAHFQEKLEDLEDQGMPPPEATRTALSSFGDARDIARLMYEAYSRGSWTETLISCQPHLIIALLFATHVWRSPVLLAAAFAGIVIIALLGLRNGSSPWLYSWMSYAVVPLLVLSYFSIDPVAQAYNFFVKGQGTPLPLWRLAEVVGLLAFTIWLVSVTAMSVARRDWILLSLMLLPLPVLALWLITMSQSMGSIAQALQSIEARFSRWDGAMASFFLTLGVTTAFFVRVRQRAIKVVAVISLGIIGSAFAARNIWGDLGSTRLFAVVIFLFLFLLIPLLLQSMLGHEQDAKANQVLPS
jgi:hypothetical protein